MAGLFEQKMNRKQFLKMLGLSIFAVFGVNSLIELFDGAKGSHKAVIGYGASRYGGNVDNH